MKKKAPFLKKTIWYKMIRYFEEPAERIAEIKECDIIGEGRIYEGILKCECGKEHILENLRVKGDPRVELNGNSNGATIKIQPSLTVCVVPPDSISQNQAMHLQKMIIANLRSPLLLISNNVQLVQLKEISESTAKKIMISKSQNN